MSGKVWTDEELAVEWDCDIRLLHKMLREGRVRGFHVGRAWRVTDSAKTEYEDTENAKRRAS